jgi:DNA recombination protein RmuC
MITYLMIGLVLGIAFGAGCIFIWQRAKFFDSEMRSIQALAELNAIKEQIKSEKSIQEKLGDQFQQISSKFYEEKSNTMTQSSIQSLQLLLNPFKEKIKEFEKKIDDTYGSEKTERNLLRGEISKLIDLNFKISAEANNLSRALKGDNKTSGNWGEWILSSILEKSGLREGEEYILQAENMRLKNLEGDFIKPDVIINLPDDKHIIIDSKVSLMHYESYANSSEVADQDRFAKAQLESIKKHIDGLASKSYQSSERLLTPDFVILFMPIEPAFALAFKYRPDLLQYAWEKNIALVSPTTLLTTLKTVATLWRQERQQRNALEIAKRGGALYDKFVGLVEDFEKLGEKIDAVSKHHSGLKQKLSTGTGNLIRQAEMLRELGAKTEKKLAKLESDNLKILDIPEA